MAEEIEIGLRQSEQGTITNRSQSITIRNTGLKPQKAEYYRKLHANPWPSVNAKLNECHIHNFSIYEREIAGKTYLFAYLEYTGRDFAADMKKMGDDPETQRWWMETDPCQTPLPDALKAGKIWSDTKEIYHLD